MEDNETFRCGSLPQCVGLNLLVGSLTSSQCSGILLCSTSLGVESQDLCLSPVVLQLVIGQFSYFLGDGELSSLDEC